MFVEFWDDQAIRRDAQELLQLTWGKTHIDFRPLGPSGGTKSKTAIKLNSIGISSCGSFPENCEFAASKAFALEGEKKSATRWMGGRFPLGVRHEGAVA
jgi:hypothetical protein